MTDDTITDAVINNTQYYYNLMYETLDSTDIRASCGLTFNTNCWIGFCEIDYTVTQPYP